MDIQNKQIKNYVDSLMAEKGFDEDLPEEIREKLKQDLYERLNNYFIAKIIELFPKDKFEILEKTIEEGNDEKTWQYIRENLPDFDTITVDLLLSFKNKYLGA